MNHFWMFQSIVHLLSVSAKFTMCILVVGRDWFCLSVSSSC